MAASLGADGPAYARIFSPLVRDVDKILPAFLGSMRTVPAHPVAAAGFGLRGLGSAQRMANRFQTEEARALVAGTAAHSMLPLTAPLSGVFPRLFTALAHRFGWPVVEGGARAIVDALVAELTSLGAHIETGRLVKGLDELPPARAVVLDVTPRQLLDLAGDAMPRRYGRALERYRYGPGRLQGRLGAQRTGAVEAPRMPAGGHRARGRHVRGDRPGGGGRERRPAPRAPVLPGDPAVRRRPAPGPGRPAHAVGLLPRAQRVRRGHDRADGGADRAIRPRLSRPDPRPSTSTAVDEEERNPSYVGGDINAGAATLRQMVFRPTVRWNPYRTALKGVYLCSAATPPGGGVHGMCGLGAARAALHDLGGTEPARRSPDGAHHVLCLVPVPHDPRSELSYFLSVILLVGALGGLSMGAVAAARSTESSFSDYVASSHVPESLRSGRGDQPGHWARLGVQPRAVAEAVPSAARRTGGEHAGAQHGPDSPPGADHCRRALPSRGRQRQRVVLHRGSRRHHAGTDGRPSQGRRVRPRCGHCEGIRVSPGGGGPRRVADQCAGATRGISRSNSTIPADQRARVKLVGIAGGQATNLFQDQDEAQGQSIELFTPALTDKLLACCSNTMLTALTLQDGNRYLSAVETEIKGVLPKGLPFVYVQVEDRVAIANDTLRPEAIALAVFGGIAGIAALLIAGQVVSRRIRLRATDLDIIRALGASPSMNFCDDLIGTLGAVAVGSVLAGLVALCLSPLAPLGPVRPFLRVEVHADWAVIGLGVAGLLLSLGSIAALASWRALPGRARARWPANPFVAGDDCGSARRTAAAGDHRGAVRPRAWGGQ